MDFIKQYWLQIRAQSEGMTASQKWLIATVLTLGLLVSGMLVIVASAPEQYALDFAPGQTESVFRSLRAAGINAEVEGDQVLVPKADVDRAMAVIIENDLTSDDASAAFDQLIAEQSPWVTDKQGERAFNIARQRVASNIIGKMAGVQRASVVISVPDRRGFDQTFDEPSAAVTVWMQAGRAVNKEIVGAIAGFVSGTLAELDPESVVVVDGNNLKRWRVPADDEALATDALEIRQVHTRDFRQKIERTLRYISGVIVEVSVETSNVHRGRRLQQQYDTTEPLRVQETQEENTRNVANAGEPGPRSNVGLDIDGGASTGTETSRNFQRSEFGDKPLLQTLDEQLTGYEVEQVNVAIGVPYGYFVNLHRSQNPPAEGEQATVPAPEAIQGLIDEHLTRIEEQVRPLIEATQPPLLNVTWVPDATLIPTDQFNTADTGLTLASTAAQWAGPIGIVGLSGAALLMMLMMVRKATQPEKLPSVEELAGVPPSLPDDDELVGEVDEVEDTLSGVELDEEELNSRRIAQQISEMIKANPTEAGHLIGKWVQTDE
ncbi:hypothetical protein [Mucisphaera sp.]|uniref:hypothetical protein n=1 Tax=Mucisphaera sp. TaxID=2913024 RepID=UPI003D14AEEE